MSLAQTGRKRLALLLCGASFGTCLVLMGGVLIFYGRPYNAMWWWVMSGILLAALVLPLGFIRPIEWVIDGYRRQSAD